MMRLRQFMFVVAAVAMLLGPISTAQAADEREAVGNDQPG